VTAVPPVLLRAGDVLQVQVLGHPEWSGDMTVTDKGFVGHVAFASVRAAGVPIEQIEAAIFAIVDAEDEKPVIVIQPLMRVAVAGEVRAGSNFKVMPGTTVGEMIFLAGGPTDRADVKNVRLMRDGSEYRVDLNDIRGSVMAPVRSGDGILVPTKRSVFRDVFLPTFSVIGSVASLIALFK
jgi:protein involved in polysaccharide export with SLBB domain